MKTNDLKTDENASTISLIITVAVLAAVGIAAFLLYQAFLDAGGFSQLFENLGLNAADAATGFVSGAVTGLFNFGKKIGEATNPFD